MKPGLPGNLKAYVADAAMLLIALVACLFLIEKAGPPGRPAAAKVPAAKAAPDNTSGRASKSTPLKEGRLFFNIDKRNIFAADGKYYTGRELKTLPQEPYSLVAVFLGKEKTAVFRAYNGSTLHLKLKDKLMDDAVVTRIDRESVEVSKGGRILTYGLETGLPKTKELKKLPENPYNLIAVVLGKEKRAVFKEFTGAIVSFSAGQKLIDGAVISAIGDNRVTVKRGGKMKEYRILHVGR